MQKKKRKLKTVVLNENDPLKPEFSVKSTDSKVNKQPNKSNKRPKKQIKPVRVSARIITLEEEKKAISDSDSRPSSRLSLGDAKRPESPMVAATSIITEKSQKRPKSPTLLAIAATAVATTSAQ